jgi:hypothetical protein
MLSPLPRRLGWRANGAHAIPGEAAWSIVCIAFSTDFWRANWMK